MASWEDTKYAAQSVYNSAGNIYQNVYATIGTTYQQFLTGRGFSPEETSLNQEIAESSWLVNPEYAQAERAYAAQEQEAKYIRNLDRTNIPLFEPQEDIDPEMWR